MADSCERRPIADASLSVLLLAFNEGPTFEEVVTAWIAALNALQREYEIILVDDGSTNQTAAWADALAGRYPRLRILHHESRRGLGAALRSGLAVAQHPLVLTATCDGQYEPAAFRQLLDLINQVDLVTGIRVGQPVPWWLRVLGAMHRLIARVVFGVPLEPRVVWLGWANFPRRLLARWVFGLRLQDVDCVLRLYRREILPRLVLQSDGPFAQVEIVAKANFLGCWLAEAPIAYHPRAQGGITGQDVAPRTFVEAWRVLNAPNFGPVKVSPTPPLAASRSLNGE